MKRYITISLLLITIALHGQHKYDRQWIFGYGDSIPLGWGLSILDFTQDTIHAYGYAGDNLIGLSSSGSFICDTAGQIMLMTNNCRIIDRNLQTVAGSDNLNPGMTNEYACQAGSDEYPGFQLSLFLPSFNDSITYLVHRNADYTSVLNAVISDRLYLTTIVKRDTIFEVKSKDILSQDTMLPGRLTAYLHEDGKRWWIYSNPYNTNIFYEYLIGGETGFEGPYVQSVGDTLYYLDVGIGQTTFSPDGTKLALNNKAKGAMVYDFDKATGMLSNYRHYPYPKMDTLPQGLCFSPDARFIYVTTPEDVYQIDIEDTDSTTSVYHIGHFRSFSETGWPVGLGYMTVGPDCRIYVSPGSTTNYIHVIDHPNEKGAACNFIERAIRTPTRVLHFLPNLPMYRTGTDCDSSLIWGFPTGIAAAFEKEGFRVYPNPTTGVVYVNIPAAASGRWYVTDALGNPVSSGIAKGTNTIDIDLTAQPSGMYFFYWYANDGSNRVEKIVHIRGG
ncbi:MAG: T9SS type A sorting domain-containing protein [Saprospiraceae bacterium]|nr:T9SS type A sorting domain-containing protein [Saprospiraceae bacterium]